MNSSMEMTSSHETPRETQASIRAEKAAYEAALPLRVKAITFNPAWLDKRGFMTNVPGTSFLDTLDLPDGVYSAIGTYVHTVPKSLERMEMLLKFEIRDFSIHQELPNGGVALITHDRVGVKAANGSSGAVWKAYTNPEGLKQWVCTDRLIWSPIPLAEDFLPSTKDQLYKDVQRFLQKATRPHYEVEEPDWVSTAGWIAYRRHPTRRFHNPREVADRKYQPVPHTAVEWSLSPPSPEEILLWQGLRGWARTAVDKTDSVAVQQYLATLKAYALEAAQLAHLKSA